MTMNYALGTFGLSLALATCILNMSQRRSSQRVIFSVGWCLFVFWIVFVAPHLRNDIFGGAFSLVASAWFLFRAVAPNYAYPVRHRIHRVFFGKRFAARIDLANERMAQRRKEAERRNISVYEVMQEETRARRR